MSETVKVLISGAVKGQFAEFFKKINSLVGKVDIVFVVGPFFGKDVDFGSKNQQIESLQKYQAAIPVYFTDTTKSEQEFIPNVHCLGRSGFRTVKNLSIAFMTDFKTETTEVFLKDREIPSNGNGVDIFIADHHPEGIFRGLDESTTLPKLAKGSSHISNIVNLLKPKYLFVTNPNTYFERLPYTNNDSSISRFYLIPDSFNSNKQKFLVALSMTPVLSSNSPPTQLPTNGVTPSPFTLKNKNDNDNDSEEPNLKKLKTDTTNTNATISTSGSTTTSTTPVPVASIPNKEAQRFSGFNRWGLSNTQVKQATKVASNYQPTKRKGACWFCLSDPDVETHLIATVGDEVYIAMAKGGITIDNSLIIPIEHVEHLSQLSQSAILEIENYKKLLRKKLENKDNTLLFIERNIPSTKVSMHAHIQVISIPNKLITNAREIIESDASKCSLFFDEVPIDVPLYKIISDRPYFFIEYGDVRLYGKIANTQKFNMQLGRQIVSKILKLPENNDWRTSVMSKDEETANAERYKSLLESQ